MKTTFIHLKQKLDKNAEKISFFRHFRVNKKFFNKIKKNLISTPFFLYIVRIYIKTNIKNLIYSIKHVDTSMYMR